MSNKIRDEIKAIIGGLNANSIISTQEQSGIIDYLFRVGKKVYGKTKWYNPGTNKAETLDTYHYEAPTNEATNRLRAVFENTAYKASERETFEMDFAKWVVLGFEYKSLNTDISYVIDERIDRLVEIENNRAVLWEKISSVLQRKEIQPEQPGLKLTEEQERGLQIAVDNGYIEKTETGYKKKCSKAKLAYILERIFAPSPYDSMPYKYLQELFNEKRLDRAVSENGYTEAKWKEQIKNLFD